MTAPAIDLADMPFAESVPVCEFWWFDCGHRCTRAASLRIVAHVNRPTHGDFTFLACEEHWIEYREVCEAVVSDPFAACVGCWKPFRRLSDLVLSVIPL